jgi:tRNA-(ms[2]io[6]A)-hydroxylase
VQIVLDDLDAFLLDHAACERKASSFALSMLLHYRDRRRLVMEMCELAREELSHFQLVLGVIDARGLVLVPDAKDAYVRRLSVLARPEPEPYFLDRLLLGGIIEARGCERFGLIAAALPAGDLKRLYEKIERSEARHRGLFLELAAEYFDPEQIRARLDELLVDEARILESLPLRPALH